MPSPDATPPPTQHPLTPAQCSLCKEDWLIIDTALHRVARSLREIAKEEQQKKLDEAGSRPPANQ